MKNKKPKVTGWFRPVFLVFDVLFWILGALLLIFIFWTIGTNADLRAIYFPAGASHFTYTVLSIGLFIFFTAIFGFVGGLIESPCLLVTYIGFVIIIMVVEICGAIAAAAVGDRIVNFRYSTWLDFNQATKDHIQTELLCCGFATYLEYSATITSLPDSCFITGSTKTAANLYTTGCWTNIEIWLNSSTGIASWVFTLIGIAIVEILCLVFAILMLVKLYRSTKVSSGPVKKNRPISQKATVGSAKKPAKAPVVQNNNVYAGKPDREKTPINPKTTQSSKAEQGTRKEDRGYAGYNADPAPRPMPRPLPRPAPAPAPTPAPEPAPVRSFSAKKIPNNNVAPVYESPRRGYDADFIRQYKPLRY